MKAEMLTWPVTAVILVIAFGTLAAAGLPLVLTAAGLVASMGVLFGITHFTDLSIWTLNFAMMFALALGIDYALFIVTRYRAALHATPTIRSTRPASRWTPPARPCSSPASRCSSACRRSCSSRSRRSSRWRPA